MELTLNDYFGDSITLKPRVELYSVRDYTGKEMPGLAIVFETTDDIPEDYGVLTKCFGEMIGLKDCAYVDTNNFPHANQLLDAGIATDTGYTKHSGFCTYPLWHFNHEFLEECGGAKYKRYSDAYEQYFSEEDDTEEEIDEPIQTSNGQQMK